MSNYINHIKSMHEMMKSLRYLDCPPMTATKIFSEDQTKIELIIKNMSNTTIIYYGYDQTITDKKNGNPIQPLKKVRIGAPFPDIWVYNPSQKSINILTGVR
jgi:hypothetical protein